jgi:hypothetical protein
MCWRLIWQAESTSSAKIADGKFAPGSRLQLVTHSAVSIAFLVGVRHWSANVSAFDGAGSGLMFLNTLSFLFSHPGWETRFGKFPAFSSSLAMFLLRDVGAARGSTMVAWRILDQPRLNLYVNL